MLKVRIILLCAALVALVAGLSATSIFAGAGMQAHGLAAPSQIDTLNLMATSPQDLPVQTADAI